MMGISLNYVYAEIYYLGALFSIYEVPVNIKVVFQKVGVSQLRIVAPFFKIIWDSEQFAHCPSSIFRMSFKTGYYI